MVELQPAAPIDYWGNMISAENCAPEDGSLIICVDGVSRNNGRPDVQAAYGIYFHRRSEFNTAGPLLRNPTYQRAGVYAAVKALEVCCEMLDAFPPTQVVRPIEIRSESTYLVNSAAPWVESRRRNNFVSDSGCSVANLDLFLELEEKMTRLQSHVVDVRFRQLFTGENIDADKLANEFLDEINQSQMQPARVDSRIGEGKAGK